MFLSRLLLRNFRCYQEAAFDNIGRLAVFIGENDAGKTVLLDAVEVLLGRRQPVPRDFHRLADGNTEDDFTLEALFNLDEADTLPNQWRSVESLHFRRVFRQETSIIMEVFVLGQGYSDPDFDGFAALNAESQKVLLRKYDKAPSGNAAGRIAQIPELVSDGILTFVERWIKISPSEVNIFNSYLPLTERISSIEYRHPESVIQRRLQAVAAQVIKPVDSETGESKEIDALAEVRTKIETALNTEIQGIVPILQQVHRKLKGVIAKPNIDFTKAISTSNMILDCGEGEQGFETFGEGTKKRIWMGLLEWESKGAGGSGDVRNVIRLYDEPDVNLHYGAQRQLFQNILDLVDDPESRSQCLVCTHSVQLIDRAPITTVTLIRVEDDNARTPCRIQGLDDADYTDFYNDVGSAVGLTNTALLYERAFLIVEGESEDKAIPIIYQNIFGRDMRDDGIRIIDLSTCGAWKSVLKILLRNRGEMVHLLLDQDCNTAASSAYVNDAILRNLGIPLPQNFLTDQISYIGVKEFEDAFDTEVIHQGIQSVFEFPEGEEWGTEEIDRLKSESEKFSEELKKRILHSCVPQHKPNAKKHYIAVAVAKQCVAEDHVPVELLNTLKRVRERAGIS